MSSILRTEQHLLSAIKHIADRCRAQYHQLKNTAFDNLQGGTDAKFELPFRCDKNLRNPTAG
jgi:hypothetical protein